MAKASTSFQLLYTSRLAPDCDFSVVKEIVDVARRSNPARGITGALLFDGERFCQLLEGAELEVRALMRHIEADPRHADVKLLHAEVAAPGSRMTRWVSGYCDAHELDGLDRLGTASASLPTPEVAPIDQFAAVLGRADTA